MEKRTQNANSCSEKLSMASKKLQFYEANGMDAKAVKENFLQALCDFANSDEYAPLDYSLREKEYRKRIGTASEIPMAALWQHLNLCNEVLSEIRTLFEKEGLSDAFFDRVDLFFVINSKIWKLCCYKYDYDFFKEAYPENDRDAYAGVGIEPDEDMPEFSRRWIKAAENILDNAEQSLKRNDLAKQRMYMADLYTIASICPYKKQKAGKYSKKLSKVSKKLRLYETNDMDTKAVEESFQQALCDFLNSDECDELDFSEQVEEYKRRIGDLSKIPMAALYQELGVAKDVLSELSDAFAKEGLSSRVKWLAGLFYVCGANVDGLTDAYDYGFNSIPYPEHREDKYQGIGIDPERDQLGYTARWIQLSQEILSNIYKAFDEGDTEGQRMFVYDLFGISLESCYICK